MPQPILNVAKAECSHRGRNVDDQHKHERLDKAKAHHGACVHRGKRNDRGNAALVQKPADHKAREVLVGAQKRRSALQFINRLAPGLTPRSVRVHRGASLLEKDDRRHRKDGKDHRRDDAACAHKGLLPRSAAAARKHHRKAHRKRRKASDVAQGPPPARDLAQRLAPGDFRQKC